MDMNDRDKKQLSKLIVRATNASNAYGKAMNDLAKFELKHWGFEHADRDIDQIIDGCCGGCGFSRGMTADEFIRLMDENRD
jgi:hypothetical protein